MTRPEAIKLMLRALPNAARVAETVRAQGDTSFQDTINSLNFVNLRGDAGM
jgi:hypothetical protein